MIGSRPDWCLSRQRVWGIGVPVIYCTECNEPVIKSSLIYHISDLILKEGGDIWFEKDASYFLPDESITCQMCGGTDMRKETDILDVWFESGSSHKVALKESNGLSFPADVYFEGSDQHRGWFNTSLLVSIATEDQAPYRTVVTHGWILDEKGKAMHKSLGNVVSPLDVMKNNGADILRLWTAANDFRADIRFSDESVTQIRDVYRRIRNTCRYLLGNLSDFSPEEDSVDKKEFWAVDRYALYDLQNFIQKAHDFYDKLEFHHVFHLINNYCTVNLSSFYLDILKDRLYTFGKRSNARRAAQTVLKEILDALVRILAPIIPFTSEEVWKEIPWTEEETSVHWELLPDQEESPLDGESLEEWEMLLEVRSNVLKCLEEARIKRSIGSSLEATVGISAMDETLKSVLERYSEELPHLFIVSDVSLDNELQDYDVQVKDPDEKIVVGVRRAPGTKCTRCWNYSESVGLSSEHPQICNKCLVNLNEEKEYGGEK
jgi:isoleucyl-tRNA synthetase